MDCPRGRAGCKQEFRPPPCPHCAGTRWWDGSNTLKRQGTLDPSGDLVWEESQVRRRVRCPNPACTHRSSTLYEAHAYPHRTFTLAVVIAAVLELLETDGATTATVARHWQCHPTTLGRWMRWIGELVAFAVLFQVCWSHDPSGMPPPVYKPRRKDLDPPKPTPRPTWKDRATLVGSLILLFEWLAKLHRDANVPLDEQPGLSAILCAQFDRFRKVYLLTKTSLPMQPRVLWVGG